MHMSIIKTRRLRNSLFKQTVWESSPYLNHCLSAQCLVSNIDTKELAEGGIPVMLSGPHSIHCPVFQQRSMGQHLGVSVGKFYMTWGMRRGDRVVTYLVCSVPLNSILAPKAFGSIRLRRVLLHLGNVLMAHCTLRKIKDGLSEMIRMTLKINTFRAGHSGSRL